MKIAYLIDRESLGGGSEYIRRKSDECQKRGGECRTFLSDAGECKPSAVDAWGADEIVVNHLKALLQLMGNPFRRPKGRVTFVVHGIHLRKYEWKMCEGGAAGIRALPLYWLRRGLESYLYHRCDRIVALTLTDRDDILRLYGRKLRVDVEPNTLDGWAAEAADSCPEGIEGPFKYLCIGRFDYQKGQDRWIKRIKNEELDNMAKSGTEGRGRPYCRGLRDWRWPVAVCYRACRRGGDGTVTFACPSQTLPHNQELRMRNAGGRTLFVGDGPMLAECKWLAKGLGVEDLCVFAGAIPNADRYLKCAEIVVSPSRWEGMPYLMMKARALGCRILATDCPGNRDVLAGYEKWEKLEL